MFLEIIIPTVLIYLEMSLLFLHSTYIYVIITAHRAIVYLRPIKKHFNIGVDGETSNQNKKTKTHHILLVLKVSLEVFTPVFTPPVQ